VVVIRVKVRVVAYRSESLDWPQKFPIGAPFRKRSLGDS
jgi:hypothetical protein